jgi:hypothetical protein
LTWTWKPAALRALTSSAASKSPLTVKVFFEGVTAAAEGGVEMPDTGTAFYGRGVPHVVPPNQTALGSLARERYVAFGEARANLIRWSVEEFLGLNAVTGPANEPAR